MQREALEIEPRQGTGKGAARRLRASGKVPGVVYGTGLGAVSVSVPQLALEKVLLHGANALLDLTGVSALDGKIVLVKDYQLDPVSRHVTHCDFYSVDVKRTIEVKIPLRFEGKPPGVEQQGGVLEPVLRELDVKCLPLAIPEEIEVDVSSLEIGDAVHVQDLPIPDGVEVMLEGSLTVVHVIAPRIEEEPTVEEGEEVAAEGEAAEGEAPDGEKAEDAEGSGESEKDEGGSS